MKPEIKQEWLEELTKQTQTTDCLQDSKGMCCLGVLCEVASRHSIGEWASSSNNECHYPFITDDGSDEAELLPNIVGQWAGIVDQRGCLPFDDRDEWPVTLADANDAGCTFDQLSDLIKHFF